MKRICLLLALAALAALPSACGQPKRDDLKSPCVGTEGSPCGPRRPANDGWMKNAA